ncbi:MAG: ArsR family transcriptional regulator [Planctomycetota bacterium]|jgi:DNA-binding transcriptional ArsR family regulator
MADMNKKFSQKELNSNIKKEKILTKFAKITQHPIRVRILEVLSNENPLTQREIGKKLSLTNAAIHYHLNILRKADLVSLSGTRQGPNSITEKLYIADKDKLAKINAESNLQNADINRYLTHTLSWINERNRAGGELIKSGEYSTSFLAGSFEINAPQDEIAALKEKLGNTLNDFFEKHKDNKTDNESITVSFSILPSNSEGSDNSRNIFEYSPDQDI